MSPQSHLKPGTRRKLYKTFTAVVGILAISHSSCFAAEPESDLNSTLSMLDPIGDSHLRPIVNGTYVSKLGPQIHPSCFKISIFSRDQVISAFENLMADAANTVLTECHQPIPELKIYTSAWISRFRRLVVTCSENVENQGFAAMFVRSQYLRKSVEPAALSGIEAANSSNDRSELEPVIVFPNLFAIRVITEQQMTPVKMRENLTLEVTSDFIHELFHATPANNRLDHNKIETIQVDPKHICGLDRESDRIVALTEICTKDEISIRPRALEYLSAKESACPEVCEDLFTSRILSTDLQSKGLNREDAALTCKKIKELGDKRTVRKLVHGIKLIGVSIPDSDQSPPCANPSANNNSGN